MNLDVLVNQVDDLAVASGPAAGVEIDAVTFDSRAVEPGALFVALEGHSFDGHDFVAAALEAGAAAVLVDRHRLPIEASAPVLSASDTRRVLGEVANIFYGAPSRALGVVGVTGTNGKSTTTWMLEALFEATGEAAGLIGTIGYRWAGHHEPAVNTTPESLVLQQLLARMREAGVARVAMEVSSHGLATHRLRGTRFDTAVFTNLTQDHLDFHGSMEAYRDAKARLFFELLPESQRAGKSPRAIINVDDAAGRWLLEEARARGVECLSYALEADADITARNVEFSLDGSRFRLCGLGEPIELHIPLLGAFNIANALAAAAAASHVGVSLEQIRAGFADLAHVPGRMQRVESDAGPAVFVDYAHTPDALERALATVRPLARGRVIAVFGCGGDRDRDKRGPMGRAAVAGADIALVTSDNPRSEDPRTIIDEVLAGISTSHHDRLDTMSEAEGGVWVEVDRGRAIQSAITHAGDDDVVLIAGKGHETYQEIAGRRVEFDDVQQARAALVARNRERT